VTMPSQPTTAPRPGASSVSEARGEFAARLNLSVFTPWAIVLLAPVIGVLLLRAPLINVLSDNDTWFYSGYGWTLAHHIEIFGWFYYADRFTVNLPIAVSTGLLGPVPAYLVLRYVLMAGCGALLYLAVRRFAAVPVAVAAVCLTMLDPFLVRLMLWDYTTFVALPCTIAGAALWYLGSTRVRAVWTALGAGIFLSAAIYANPLSAVVLPPLFGVEAIAAIRRGRGEVVTFIIRWCLVAAGAVIVFIVGYLGYWAYIGSFSPKLLFQATISFIQSNSQLAAPFQIAPRIWLRTEPRVYAPVLVSVGTIVILGRSFFSNTLRARMAQFAVGYTLVFWVYRFALTSSVVETWWAYSMTAVSGAFAMPAILDAIGQRWVRTRWLLIAGMALAATGLADLVVRSMGQSALNMFNYLRSHTVVLVCVLVACCLAVALATVLRKERAGLLAIAVFCAIVAVIALTPAQYLNIGGTGEFSTFGTTAELDGYTAGYDMTQLIAKYDRPPSRVLIWDDLYGLGAVGWANLPHQEGGVENVSTLAPIPVLTPWDLNMLRYPTTTRVLALSQEVNDIVSAVPALQKAGLQPRLESEGIWGGGHVYYALIKLHSP
jgi:hypothetical protein